MSASHRTARQQLERSSNFLTPFLPLVNCHMVEFFTEDHWEKHIPEEVKKEVDQIGFSAAIEKFWEATQNGSCQSNGKSDSSALSSFVAAARSHRIVVDGESCLSVTQAEQRIESWGGVIMPEIRVSEFMSSKKAYEVQAMSRLVASLQSCCGPAHCVDVGGGRGQLPTVLALGYRLYGLTVDCDAVALAGGIKRDRLIKKQWHAIAKVSAHHNMNPHAGTQVGSSDDLHRHVNSYVTKDTDLCGLVRDSFPEHCNADIKLLLTGLHTCGDLGPSSLRLFATQPAVCAALNVPCCYHLLTEPVDRNPASHTAESLCMQREDTAGFPMSQFLRGYQLGRNARMLASQSIDRVAHQRQWPSRSLHYRALLQVIVKTHLRTDVPEGKLKRVSSKCKNFTEYLNDAAAILNLTLDMLPQSYLVEFSSKYEIEWKKLVLFYLLRLTLAQVVESVILLDRVLFLRELGYNDVFLVQLFDPVLSPRCHGILVKR